MCDADLRLSGCVLAGGRSRRMGTDKARLLVDGQPLVCRVFERVAAVAEDVHVASGDGQRLADLGLPEIPDAFCDAGPLAGILAGLRAARHPLVAVVACDLPEASPAVLAALARCWQGDDVIVPVVAGRAQPLHAVWATTAAEPVAELLAAGTRRVQDALQALRVRRLDAAAWAAADPGARFARNLNRPVDLTSE